MVRVTGQCMPPQGFGAVTLQYLVQDCAIYAPPASLMSERSMRRGDLGEMGLFDFQIRRAVDASCNRLNATNSKSH
jgi:hypothetical protein